MQIIQKKGNMKHFVINMPLPVKMGHWFYVLKKTILKIQKKLESILILLSFL